MSRIQLITDLDTYFDVLDLAADSYADQVVLFKHQRAQLEMSRLTRELLTHAQLNDILTQAAVTHKVIKCIDWYYQYLFVVPLITEMSSLLYKLELPLISQRPYLLYNVLSYPVPIANLSYFVTIDTP